MMKRNHMIVSAAGAVATASLLNHSLMTGEPLGVNILGMVLVLAAGASGGIAPDIDTKIPSAVPRAIFWLLTLPIPPVHKKLMHPKFEFGHRTWSHCLAAVALMVGLAYLAGTHLLGSAFEGATLELARLIVYGWAYGYAWHLAADMTTKAGVPLLWPITDYKFHLLPSFLRITTGKSMLEGAYAIFLASLCVFFTVGAFFG